MVDSVAVSTKYSVTGVPLELPPECAELFVNFTTTYDSDAVVNKIALSFMVMLDNPHRVIPLQKISSPYDILQRINFCHGGFFSTIKVEHVFTLGQLFKRTSYEEIENVLNLPPWSEHNKDSLLAMVYGSYYIWSVQIPCLNKITRRAFFECIWYSKKLERALLSYPFDSWFSYVPDVVVSKSNQTKFLVGKKDFCDFDDLGVEHAMWRMFWNAVVAKRPDLDKPARWGLRCKYYSEPVFRFSLVLAWRASSEPNVLASSSISIPYNMNLWSAIIYLFSTIGNGFYPLETTSIGAGPSITTLEQIRNPR